MNFPESANHTNLENIPTVFANYTRLSFLESVDHSEVGDYIPTMFATTLSRVFLRV